MALRAKKQQEQFPPGVFINKVDPLALQMLVVSRFSYSWKN